LRIELSGVELTLTHHPGDDPEYVVKTASGRHYSVPSSIFQVLLLEHAQQQLVDGASTFNGTPRNRAEQEHHIKIQAMLNRFRDAEDIPRRLMAKGYWLRIPLIPEKLVDQIASIGAVAFSPKLWPVLLVVALISAVGAVSIAHAGHLKTMGPIADLAVAYVFAFTAYMFHEIGHASALKASGVRPGKIGFTMYLIFPAFYSDVTGAWSLPKFQRAAVDVGGCYFEGLFSFIYFICLLLTHETSLFYALLMIGGSIVNNANPVFRFDGYWLIRDLFGVTNILQLPRLMHMKHRGDFRRLIPAQVVAFCFCGIWLAYVFLMLKSLGDMLESATTWLF